MRTVKILLSAGLLLICTSCLRKYTCAEAVIHCPGCRAGSTEFIDIPYNIMDWSLPQACYLLIQQSDAKQITGGGTPSLVMQDMIIEYRACTDRTLNDNFKRKACLTSLEERSASNRKAAEAYCTRRGYVFEESRQVCVLPPE
ncbi:MAG: hypothetical protein WC261_07020 [Synergistaceae bacterium]|nr:hypothetical protein [Dehalococcoidales bacterium]